ncbi:Deoxyribonuclease gamma [Galemys pyrenaicus]|uniref:Deoxyribonuclease n=1 Tax=Galemys pyrenaicus TaxID=202257 RepID=A0A8J6AMR1_GALPY|nr:Deoxyribonuclease gamma [Galemys pyrenaicus]
MAQPLASLLLLLLCTSSSLALLKICSFNVRSFGEAKKDNGKVMDVIVKVIKRCDIMLLMEIKDSNNIIGPMLMEKLNGEKLVSVKKHYLYHDYQPGDVDVFSREPFVVWFQSPHTAVKDFVIIPLHSTPETSIKEIDELFDVYMDVKRRWSVEVRPSCLLNSHQAGKNLDHQTDHAFQNFIFMGDFNAGCSYVPKKAWKNIRLRTDPRFVWLIGDDEDTTVKKSTNCAYDRIVLRGQEIINSVVPKSSGVFDFQKAFGLTEEEALDVSDHFPVEFKLGPSKAFTNSKKSVSPKKRRKGSRS